MGDFDLRGCGVTADALDTQKENQKTAYDEIKEYFAAQKLLKEVMAAGGKYLKRNRKKSSSIVTREYSITIPVILAALKVLCDNDML